MWLASVWITDRGCRSLNGKSTEGNVVHKVYECLFWRFQETVLFWEEKARGKGKERDLFLFEKGIVNTKRKEGGRKFIFKNMLKVRNRLLKWVNKLDLCASFALDIFMLVLVIFLSSFWCAFHEVLTFLWFPCYLKCFKSCIWKVSWLPWNFRTTHPKNLGLVWGIFSC